MLATSISLLYNQNLASTGCLLPFKKIAAIHLLKIQSNCIQSASLKMLTLKHRFDVKIHTPQVVETKAFPTNGGV